MSECPHYDLSPLTDGWVACGCGVSIPPRGEALAVATPSPLAPIMPVRWSQSLEDELVALVDLGARPASAAGAVGVGPNMWERWRRAAKAGEQPYAGLVARAEQAHAMCRAQAQGKVMKDRPEAWLERNDPKWARKSSVEVKGKIAHEHKHVDLTALTLEELRAKRDALALELGAEEGSPE